LDIAQQLYLNALISYPRTDSQKLPPTIGYKMILKGLSKDAEYKRPASELLARQTLRPNEGKKHDAAHPAIYPTGNLPERGVEPSKRKIWDLVVRRFMSVFGEPAVKQSMKTCVRVGKHRFYLHGARILAEGWIHYYEPYVRLEEATLPLLEEGQSIIIKTIESESLFTEPPARYNPSSLLRKMEEAGIGTKATRADTIQILYDRGYVKNEKMTVTCVGFEVSEILEKHCPIIISTAFTRELEAKMNRVRENKERREEIIAEVIETLKPVLEKLKKEEKTIGEQLGVALEKAKLEERTIGTCPVCNTGKLIVTYSRKTGKRFVGCTNYFKGLCKTSFPLPQKGTLRQDGKKCPKCGCPTVQVKMNRRPWILCINPKCPSKRGRRED
jgi:DNA topoisomerase-1